MWINRAAIPTILSSRASSESGKSPPPCGTRVARSSCFSCCLRVWFSSLSRRRSRGSSLPAPRLPAVTQAMPQRFSLCVMPWPMD